jgi:hypothetical protein
MACAAARRCQARSGSKRYAGRGVHSLRSEERIAPHRRADWDLNERITNAPIRHARTQRSRHHTAGCRSGNQESRSAESIARSKSRGKDDPYDTIEAQKRAYWNNELALDDQQLNALRRKLKEFTGDGSWSPASWAVWHNETSG